MSDKITDEDFDLLDELGVEADTIQTEGRSAREQPWSNSGPVPVIAEVRLKMNPRRQELYDKIRSDDIADLIHSDLASQVEEADVELCASGFDNFLLASDLSELYQHQCNLRQIGATDSSKVIQAFVTWVHRLEQNERENIFDLHGSELHQFWKDYDEASCRENPQELAARARNKQGEQCVAPQPTAHSESDLRGSLPASA